MDFAKIAPFLTNPLVLIGFSLFLFIGLVKQLIKAGIIPKVTKEAGGGIIRVLLDYSFYLAFLVIILGFILEGWKVYIHEGKIVKKNIAIEANSGQTQSEPTVNIIDNITDEAGNQINNKEAPFKIRVKGIVSNAKIFYT